MGNSNNEHRPLRGGLWIRTGKTNDSGGLDVLENGTLTGLATRSNGDKVLVTCKHVMTGYELGTTAVAHGMYQHTVEQSIMTDEHSHATHPIDATKKIGTGQPVLENYSDIAMCILEDGVKADFGLHTHPIRSSEHENEVVISGTVEPVAGNNATRVLVVGARSGDFMATVIETNHRYTISHTTPDGVKLTRVMTNVVRLQTDRGHLVRAGDSGAACLVKVPGTENQYKMCCVLFGGNDSRIGLALPASDVEQELGIRFGIISPVVEAGQTVTAYGGEKVILQGSVTNRKLIDSSKLTYQWTQEASASVPTVTLAGDTTLSPSFTPALNETGAPITYRFILTVTNEGEVSGKDTAMVTVRPGTRPNNPPPPTPTPTPTPTWEYTGRTDGCGPSFRRERRRGSVTEWESDPQPDPWGDYEKTGTTRGCGPDQEAEELSTSECGRTRTRWVDDPQPDPWGGWVDTGNTEHFAPGVFYKEQQRTSNCGNTETTWVPV